MDRNQASGARRDPRGRLWPDERQELLLRAALSPPPAAIEAWERIRPGLDLDSLDRGSERLLPLVWANLRPDGADGARLSERYDQARLGHERLLGQLSEVLQPLHDRGIPTVMLKGMALVVSAYRDAGTRPMSDIDVLVPLGQVAHATRLLQEAGWKPSSPVTPAMTRLSHSVPFLNPPHPPLDLHWHVFEECCRATDDNDFWAASVPVTIGGAPTRIPAAEDQLLQVCVHGEKWVKVPGVRWIADAMLLIRHAPKRFEQRFSVRDRRRPWLLVYWCNHVRSAPGGFATAALTFPTYLQAVWRLGSVTQVPGAAMARVLGRAAGR